MQPARFLFLFALVTLPILALDQQPAADYYARRVALAEKLHGGAALIFGADEPAIKYESWRQGEDFYYLTAHKVPLRP